MTSFRSAFPSKYLKPEDIGSTRPIAMIAKVEFADVGSGTEVARKLVVVFDSDTITFATPVNGPDRAMVLDALDTKTWVLNRINSETIAEIVGSEDFESWVGHRVELLTTKTEYQGKRVPCIRCQAPAAPKKTPKTPVTTPAVPVTAAAAGETDTPGNDIPF